MNAPGNKHTLAIRILALWLESKGRRPEILAPQSDADRLLSLVTARQTDLLLISMALPEQFDGVREIAASVAQLPESIRPRTVVGGYAVKVGLVPPIHGADLLADVSLLR